MIRYRSDPVDDDIHVAGPAEITLQLTCTAMDTHVQVRLCDLAPDGTSSVVSVGWLLASHRTVDEARSTPTEVVHDHTHPVPVQPGQPFTARFSLFPFAQLLRKGHRLVLEIGSDPRRLAPGTQDRFVYFGSAGTPYPALNAVLHDRPEPGALVLTIRP